MSDRPPVTCHILDTTTGKPAANVNCAIYKLSISDGVSSNGDEIYTEAASAEPFAMASTNADGRVPAWVFDPDPSKRELLKDLGIIKTKEHALQWETLVYGIYKIRFQVGKYYQSLGQSSFHPFVEIVFKVEDSRHYHIPLLLSNYGYTTYRGS